MANLTEAELRNFSNLDEMKRSKPKEVWEMPPAAWRIFDRLFTARIKETQQIFIDKDYNINREDGAVIVGLIQFASSFLFTIGKSEKYEFTKEGRILACKDFCDLKDNVLRNDLFRISMVTEGIMDFNDKDNIKERLEGFYKETYNTINKLKQLTSD